MLNLLAGKLQLVRVQLLQPLAQMRRTGGQPSHDGVSQSSLTTMCLITLISDYIVIPRIDAPQFISYCFYNNPSTLEKIIFTFLVHTDKVLFPTTR